MKAYLEVVPFEVKDLVTESIELGENDTPVETVCGGRVQNVVV